jgi:hypothetical protein
MLRCKNRDIRILTEWQVFKTDGNLLYPTRTASAYAGSAVRFEPARDSQHGSNCDNHNHRRLNRHANDTGNVPI